MLQTALLVISIIGLIFGVVVIVALFVKHSEVNAIDAKYQETYKATKAMLDAMSNPKATEGK